MSRLAGDDVDHHAVTDEDVARTQQARQAAAIAAAASVVEMTCFGHCRQPGHRFTVAGSDAVLLAQQGLAGVIGPRPAWWPREVATSTQPLALLT